MRRRSFLKGLQAAALAVMLPLQLTGFGDMDYGLVAPHWQQYVFVPGILFIPSRPVLYVDVGAAGDSRCD